VPTSETHAHQAFQVIHSGVYALLVAPCVVVLCRTAVLKMRKLIPCYLTAFASARQLQGPLFAAQSLSDWQRVISDPDRWGFDPVEPYPVAALRRPRLKGGGPNRGSAQQRVVLPKGWLDDTRDSFDEEWMSQDSLITEACEG
jgi:hypothetical protein